MKIFDDLIAQSHGAIIPLNTEKIESDIFDWRLPGIDRSGVTSYISSRLIQKENIATEESK